MTAWAGRAAARVVFDFGAVVFHWRPLDLLRRTIPAQAADDASAASWARRFFQDYGGDWGEFDRGAIGSAEVVRRIAARTGLAPAGVQAVVDAVPAELQPLPDSVALVQRLHAAGVPLHYLSNMPAPYAAHLQATHAFLRCFSSGVFSSDVQLIKPDPAIFALAAARFGAAPGDLLFFDDLLPNVQAAQAAGWQALQFTGAAAATAALRERGLLA